MQNIQLAQTEEQIYSCYRVMRQLRPHLDDEKNLWLSVLRQIDEGYRLVYLQERSGQISCRISVFRVFSLGKNSLHR